MSFLKGWPFEPMDGLIYFNHFSKIPEPTIPESEVLAFFKQGL